ncbi:MAG: hypothetical protein JST32_02565 [Bacteroidetes bacterium]|nr:hypothetical protein [Bacteroidota bacterium]
MKSIFLSIWVLVSICSANPLYGQQTITTKNLEGIWQYGSPHVGDQLNQSFTFYSNGSFFFDNGKLGDDLVSTVELKGYYRLIKNKIFFTIISKTVIDNAKIGVRDHQAYVGIFEYKNRAFKVVREKNPKELLDPVIVTVIKPDHIQINDEDYFKVTSNPKATP